MKQSNPFMLLVMAVFLTLAQSKSYGIEIIKMPEPSFPLGFSEPNIAPLPTMDLDPCFPCSPCDPCTPPPMMTDPVVVPCINNDSTGDSSNC
jgi:hypothetical protein